MDDDVATAATIGAPIAAVFETHVQADHVSGLPALVERTAPPPSAGADDAVCLLRAGGLKARRLDVGFPEWRRAGLAIETTG